MHTEETKDRGDKTQSTGFGFYPMGQEMFEMMNKCCAGQGGFPECSGMMKSMMETMTKQHSSTPKENTFESERKKG